MSSLKLKLGEGSTKVIKSKMKKIISCTKLIETFYEKIHNERNDTVKRSQFLQTQVTKQRNKISGFDNTIESVKQLNDVTVKRKYKDIDNLNNELKNAKREKRYMKSKSKEVNNCSLKLKNFQGRRLLCVKGKQKFSRRIVHWLIIIKI